VWISSDRDQYPLQKAQQFSCGFILNTAPVIVDVDFYYRTLNGITSMTFGFLNEFGPAVSIGKGFPTESTYCSKRTNHVANVADIYLSGSQNKYETVNNGNYFPSSSEITHSISLSFLRSGETILFQLDGFYTLADRLVRMITQTRLRSLIASHYQLITV
jgi:hypothetical protein